jgi:plasmid maintenance system antidote protein VapI
MPPKRSMICACRREIGSKPTPGFWMNLQKRYDRRVAEQAIAKELDAIETFRQEAA